MLLAVVALTCALVNAGTLGTGTCTETFSDTIQPAECANVQAEVSNQLTNEFQGTFGPDSTLTATCGGSSYAVTVVVGDASGLSCADFSKQFNGDGNLCSYIAITLDANIQAPAKGTTSSFDCTGPTGDPSPNNACTCTCSCQSPLNASTCTGFDTGCSFGGLGASGVGSCNAGSATATCSNLECDAMTEQTCTVGCVSFGSYYENVCSGTYAKQGAGSSSLGAGAIAGIVIGCVLGVAIVGGIIFFLLRRKAYSKI